MPSQQEQILQALNNLTSTISSWAPKPKPSGGNTTKKRPRENDGPGRKRRRRSEQHRHGSQHRRRQERQHVIDQALQQEPSRPSERPRPRLSQGSSRYSRSPTSRAPEAIPLKHTAAFYHFHPGMRTAMINGYDNGSLHYKEFTPVISTRFTRAGRKKQSKYGKNVQIHPQMSSRL